jgi:hypothetical protein
MSEQAIFFGALDQEDTLARAVLSNQTDLKRLIDASQVAVTHVDAG